MPKVSIITPVYNAAKYLTDTVRSVQAQTYSDWQLILVDDCSTDGSLDLCKELAAADSRIVVLRNKANSGPATTRNNGIEYAIEHGVKYLSFLDSDDIDEPDFLDKMVATAENYSADIVWCNYYEYPFGHGERKTLQSHRLPSLETIEEKRLLSLFFEETTGLGSLCDKLYSVELVTRTGIRINPERVRAEDWEFNLMLFQQHPRVIAIDDALYNYIHYPRPSVMATYRPRDYEMFWRSRQLLQDMAEREGIDYDKEKFDSTLMYNIINQLLILSKAGNVTDKQAEYNKIIKDSKLQQLLKNGHWHYNLLPKSFKLVAFLLKSHLNTLLRIYLHI